MMNIRILDLNVFVVIEALVREHSVTRAADRLGLSQPEVSAALKHLRQQFGDPLLLRTRDGLLPTPRGQEFYAALYHSVDSIQNEFQDGKAPAPERTRRSFNGLRVLVSVSSATNCEGMKTMIEQQIKVLKKPSQRPASRRVEFSSTAPVEIVQPNPFVSEIFLETIQSMISSSNADFRRNEAHNVGSSPSSPTDL